MDLAIFRRTGLAVVVGAVLSGAAVVPTSADTRWPGVMESCRALVKSGNRDGALERECYLMMAGVKEVLQIIGSDYYPVGKNAGFCMVPGTSAMQLASALVTYSDIDPNCEKTSAMSGCLSEALRHSFAKGCDM